MSHTPSDITAVRIVTSNYTMTAEDRTILADATAGSLTVNLITTIGNRGLRQTVKKIAGIITNTVVLAATGSETIDGALTQVIATLGVAMVIQSDGANWHVV